MEIANKQKIIINIVFYCAVFLIIYLLSKWLFMYLFPFIIGTIITISIQKPAVYLSSKTKLKKGFWALILVLFIYVVIIIVVSTVILSICYYMNSVLSSENSVISEFSTIYNSVSIKFKNIKLPSFLNNQLTIMYQGIANSITKYITNLATLTFKNIPKFLTGAIFTLIASCYIATDFDRFKASIMSITKPNYIIAIKEIKIIFKENVFSILIGYFKLLIITFFELAIGLFLLKCKKAIIISFIIAFLDLLPVLGTGTVLIPWALYSIAVSNYFFGIGLFILYGTIILIRNILEPKIIGKQIGLHPLIALICVFLGLKLFGIIGIFILPIITILIYKMYDRGVFELLRK